MVRKKKRKTRVTKKQVREMREFLASKRKKSNKNRIIPGPWTNTETKVQIGARLRKSTGVMNEILGVSIGNYLQDEMWFEPGWYPLVFNIESDNIKEEVAKHGMDQYLAASEKALNNILDSKGKKLFGTIIILQATVDNSQHDDTSHRFISCRAKTNKKSIKGFKAMRKKEYKILE